MLLDMVTYLQDDILVKIDRGSMFSSLETRTPFLDYKLIEWSLGLPKDLKFSEIESKVALRKVLYKYIPKELVERPKMGFGIPIDIWLKKELRDWAEDLLSESSLKKDAIFNVKTVRSIWKDHLEGKRQNQHKLWAIINFQAWNKYRQNNR